MTADPGVVFDERFANPPDRLPAGAAKVPAGAAAAAPGAVETWDMTGGWHLFPAVNAAG